MTDFQTKWKTRQRARWLRPDAVRFVQPDSKRYLQSDHARRFLPQSWERKYSPDQPRDWHGRWTDGGGEASPSDDSSDDSTSDTTELSAQGKGHHIVPVGVYGNLPLSPEAREAFDDTVTGTLRDPTSNRWDQLHRDYNRAVAEKLDQFMAEKGITPESMTAQQAREFAQSIRTSVDPRIRGLNMRIYMREILYWLRRVPRE
jgi:hypothetical protein